jgi:ABC-type sugar transport system ATPase subunit
MIELSGVTIEVGAFVLRDISFRVETGQYAVVMGKTGAGKTTILEAICGLRKVKQGRISIDGIDVTNWSPADRNVGYTPQDLALFPTFTVRGHLEFGMRLRKRSKTNIARHVGEIAALLQIESLLERGVQGLSGGEAQRVALGRALTYGPSVLLLDEPLSALDATTRGAAQEMLKRINRQTGVTVLHVTHNQEEADALADCCIRLDKESAQASHQQIERSSE